jgi:eukaryotic-like serine/threonine-protein kinase
MEPDRWRVVELLYHRALERPVSARGAFLNDACAGDAALRQAIESLLAVHSGAERFLETPAVELAARALAETAPMRALQLTPGTRLGSYEIVSLLGAGGMG